MTTRQVGITYNTIVRKEVIRFLRIWTQTLLPSVVTSVLYFVIFGNFIGSQLETINGFTYMQFIVPGLIMMAVITNAFSNVVGSFYGAKFMRNIDELLVSSTPAWVIVAGFITGGTLRGVLSGLLVLAVALFFTDLAIFSIAALVGFMVLTSILFSLAGLLNGIYARSFDEVTIVPTFVLTPLTYLGGVFYSVSVLPVFWQKVSLANPILYMVNGFRYGFLGLSDVSVFTSIGMLVVATVLLTYLDCRLISRGTGLRT